MKHVETVHKVLSDAIFEAIERFKRLYYPKGTENPEQAQRHHKAAILSLAENIDRLYQDE